MAEHPRITPEEIARLIAEEQGIPVEELAAEFREHVERFGPAEAEVRGTIYSVWIEDDNEKEETMTERNPNVQANVQEEQPMEATEQVMEQEENVEATEPKAVHHQTIRDAELAIARKEISQESHAAVLKGRISLTEAKALGRNAGPDGPVGQSTTKAATPKKDKPVTLCIACGKPTKGGRFHPGGDMKIHRMADEHLRGERELTDEQREYLEESGKLEQARKRAEKQKAKAETKATKKAEREAKKADKGKE